MRCDIVISHIGVYDDILQPLDALTTYQYYRDKLIPRSESVVTYYSVRIINNYIITFDII